jgi:hypothetical protein
MPLVDLLLFAASAAMAWLGRWQAGDLVWGLWLSSLIVGYGLLLVGILSPVVRGDPSGWGIGQSGPPPLGPVHPVSSVSSPAGLWVMRLLELPVAAFLIVFFTFHFGMFHLVHGIFLSMFFPPTGAAPTGQFSALGHEFKQILATHWSFVVLSLISAREAFAQASVAFTPFTSYRNVIRMHLMIFFFAFAKLAHLDGRLIYLAVLFVYFYPWQAMRRVAGLVRHGAQSEGFTQPRR